MQKRILGKTGLEVSVIGFGSIKLPGVQKDEAAKMPCRPRHSRYA